MTSVVDTRCRSSRTATLVAHAFVSESVMHANTRSFASEAR